MASSWLCVTTRTSCELLSWSEVPDVKRRRADTKFTDHANATAAVRKGMSKRFPIPVVLLARLAIDRSQQGRGFGAALLPDAMRRAVGLLMRWGSARCSLMRSTIARPRSMRGSGSSRCPATR
jgi:GNAT superfamily N-acetyltransferase